MTTKKQLKELLNTRVKFSQIYLLIIMWVGAMFTYLVKVELVMGYFVFLFIGNLAFMFFNYMERKSK